MIIMIQVNLLPHININISEMGVTTIRHKNTTLSRDQIAYALELLDRARAEVEELATYDENPDEPKYSSQEVADQL